MTTTPLRLLALAAAASLALGAAASAQDNDLGRLHADLNLTPAQEGAWRAFEAASRPDPDQQARHHAAEDMMARLPGPQRVQLAIDVAEADLATLRQHGAALRTFYAVLDADQRVTFDRDTLPSNSDEDR